MAHYIDKDALVAEIERLENKLYYEPENFKDVGAKMALDSLKYFLDTLEVKEVDLEKEIELVKGDYEQVDVGWNNDFDFIARHFFELGVNASNSLTWKDIDLILDITDQIANDDSMEEKLNNMSQEEYCTEVLKRFKAQKGEKVC